MLFVSYHGTSIYVGTMWGIRDTVLDNESAPRSRNDIERIRERLRQEFIGLIRDALAKGDGLNQDLEYTAQSVRITITFWAEM